jgi:hypothetical protein
MYSAAIQRLHAPVLAEMHEACEFQRRQVLKQPPHPQADHRGRARNLRLDDIVEEIADRYTWAPARM